MNRGFRLTGAAIVGIALGTAVLLVFVPTLFALFLGQISILLLLGLALFLRFVRDGRMIVLGSIPGHSNRSVRWQSVLEENCRKGTDS